MDDKTNTQIGKLFGLLFLTRDLAHKFHLASKSYAEHMILNDFYHEIIENADSLIESYQGKFGLVDIPRLNNDAKPTSLETLRTHSKYIEDTRYKALDKSEAAVQSLVDVVLTTFYSAIYKLENLK
jgi:hypothetical protein